MSVRYHSAEGAIRAAGAAFACSEDDLSFAQPRSRKSGSNGWLFAGSLLLIFLLA